MKSNLAGLSAEQRAAAQQVLSRVRGQFDLAFYSGSLIAGLGHATSDVDVHVVIPDGVRLERLLHQVGDQTVQLTTVERSRFRRIAELGSRLTATTVDRGQFELNSGSLWDLLRTGMGVLIEGHGEALSLFESIDPNVVRQVLMGNHAHPVARFAKDANGLLRSGSAQSAYVCAIHALSSAIELVLAAGGDLYSVPKFQFARLARSVYADQMDLLWQLMYAGPMCPESKDVERRLWAAAGLVANGLLNGWESALTNDAALEPVGDGVIRSPYWSLMRFSDGFALAGPVESLRVSAPVARLWSLLDGRSLDDLIETTGVESSAPVTKTIARLVQSGAALGDSEVEA